MHTKKGKSTDVLEVEDEDQRHERIQGILERLNTSRAESSAAPPFDPPSKEAGPIDPPTELLARVEAFLPQLKASNEILAQQLRTDPKRLDIENIEDTDSQVIVMNLGLGVFEDRSAEVHDHESDSESTDSDTDSTSTMTTSESSSDGSQPPCS